MVSHSKFPSNIRLLAISGSLRAKSSNTAVLRAAALLAPSGVEVAFYEGLGALPHFNPDHDDEAPPGPVIELRRAVGACHGVLICSPEYARGVAGSFKNALDWLVGGFELPGKPVAVINASARATEADAQLRIILSTMSANLVGEASITLALPGPSLNAAAIAADRNLAERLRVAIERFTQAIAAPSA